VINNPSLLYCFKLQLWLERILRTYCVAFVPVSIYDVPGKLNSKIASTKLLGFALRMELQLSRYADSLHRYLFKNKIP
jgi:hypothetical protein